MGKHYQIERPQDKRRVKFAIIAGTLVLVIVMSIAGYVIYDLNKNKLAVDNSQNRATLGAVASIKEETQLVQTDLYQMKIPADWRKVTNPEVSVGNRRYYPDRYQGTTGNHIGRKLDVYIGSIPPDLGIDKVVAVAPSGNHLIIEETSGQCYYFTDVPEGKSANTYPSFWEEQGIKFSCRTSVLTNVLGAIHQDQSIGVTLPTGNSQTNFFLVYTDHGSSTDNNIFMDILESFRTK